MSEIKSGINAWECFCLVAVALIVGILLGRFNFSPTENQGEVEEGFVHPADVELGVYDFKKDGVPETIISYKGVPVFFLKEEEAERLRIVDVNISLGDDTAGGDEEAPMDERLSKLGGKMQ